MNPAWGFVTAAILFAFACGIVVGIALREWIARADAEEVARAEARRNHPAGRDWRDPLTDYFERKDREDFVMGSWFIGEQMRKGDL